MLETGGSAADDRDASEWHALLKLCLATVPWVLAVAWIWSLQMALVLVLVLGLVEHVSRREAIELGLVQATWVAGVPMGLLFLSHVIHNGWRAPHWRLRWVLVAGFALIWVAILGWWMATVPGDTATGEELFYY